VHKLIGLGLVCTVLFAVTATAGVRSQCRRLCRPEIARCHAGGFTRAACRRVLHVGCITRGATLCLFVPPATTSTVPRSRTTALTSSTTTTTVPGSCSTPFAGTWQIEDGHWSTPDGCGVYDARLSSPFLIAGCTNGQLLGSINTIPGGTESAPRGSQWSDALTLDTGVFDGGDGCLYDAAITASGLTLRSGTSAPRYQGLGTLTILQLCGAVGCTTTYSGEAYQF
jgi:hypothetical protein